MTTASQARCRATVSTGAARATYPVAMYARCSRQVAPGSQKYCWQHKPTLAQQQERHAAMMAEIAARKARKEKQ